MIKVKDLLTVLTFTTNVCIFEYCGAECPEDDEYTEFYSGPVELIPCALHECVVRYSYILDNIMQICVN